MQANEAPSKGTSVGHASRYVELVRAVRAANHASDLTVCSFRMRAGPRSASGTTTAHSKVHKIKVYKTAPNQSAIEAVVRGCTQLM
jgi:hypothetical protein